jgi:hypothetical protein
MNYFVGIVLCIATVSAEAIPETLTLGPIQNCLYEQAYKTSIVFRPQPLQKSTEPNAIPPKLTTPVPTLLETKAPNELPQAPLKPDLKPTPSTAPDVSPKGSIPPLKKSTEPKPSGVPAATVQKSIEPNVIPKKLTTPVPTLLETKASNELPQAPLKPDLKPTPSTAPNVSPKGSIPPLSKPAEPKQSGVPTVPSSGVEAAKARARALYGKEPGFVGVTDRVMTTRDGQRFLYINIKGDGNCGFYAIGVDRARFVNAIEDLVSAQHDVFQAFVNDRSSLVLDIGNLRLSGDTTAIAANVRTLAGNADNGGNVTSTLKILTDFATEKTAYHAELFQDARNALIKNLQKLQGLPNVTSSSELREHINTLELSVISANIEDVNVADLTRQYNELINSPTQVKVDFKHIQSAFKALTTVCEDRDIELFEKAKLQLINKIENLTTLSSYEAFLSALKKELIASKIKEADLDTKENLLKSVRSVFSKNRGPGTWIPGGLFAAIKDRLGVEYNIWSKDYSGDLIKLLSSSSDSRGVAAKGPRVRNVFFTGGHYDMLIPFDE